MEQITKYPSVIRDHASFPVPVGMLAIASLSAQPSVVPNNINITGRYTCSIALSGGDTRSEVSLMYNVHTGNLVGLPSNSTRHSFGFNMGWRNIERSHDGIFYWGPDMRNKNFYPALTNPLFLLENGDLASVRLTAIKDGSGYCISDADMTSMAILSKTGTFPDLQKAATEITRQLVRIWKGNTYENESSIYT